MMDGDEEHNYMSAFTGTSMNTILRILMRLLNQN